MTLSLPLPLVVMSLHTNRNKTVVRKCTIPGKYWFGSIVLHATQALAIQVKNRSVCVDAKHPSQHFTKKVIFLQKKDERFFLFIF